jgi:signal peptidase I
MHFNFELILTLATFITAILWLVDKYLARKNASTKWLNNLGSFFPVLLIVLLVRSFVIEPFRIPSGSLEPTLLTGDFIFVNKYKYDVRLPITHKKIMHVNQPKTGDIIVFRWPPDPEKYDFIKRVIGVPGDKIDYIDKVIYINDKPVSQQTLGPALDMNSEGNSWLVEQRQEDLNNFKHDIYINNKIPAFNFYHIVVPEGMYFVMGDNRDDSQDSRFWGFVPEENIVGKAVMVWLSWNHQNHSIRFQRIGKIVH